MKKNIRKRMNLQPVHTSNSNNLGITLIALIITIIVMLILVVVSITTVIRGGLFQKAGEGVRDTNIAATAENEIGAGRVTTNGVEYSSMADYATLASGGTVTINGTEYSSLAEYENATRSGEENPRGPIPA